MTRFACLVTVITGLAASVSSAAFIVPYTGPETTGLNTPYRNAGRTFLTYLNSSQLTTINQPTFINGLQLKMSLFGNGAIPATWPSQPLTFANYTIQVSNSSAAVKAAGELPTLAAFTSYQGANKVTVYNGPLTIQPGSFVNNGVANPFGPEIVFTTPFLYNPGDDLEVYISQTGYLPNTEPQPFFAAGSFAGFTADAVSSTLGAAQGSPNGFSNPVIFQFDVVSTPVPATALCGLFAIPVIGLIRRKRA